MKSEQRPWGSWTILDEGEGFKVKRIEVNPKSKLSLQRHKHRSEIWIIVSGVANAVKGEMQVTLKKGNTFIVPKESVHRLINSGDKPLVVIETQLGHYLEEDDIERLEDDYNRVDIKS